MGISRPTPNLESGGRQYQFSAGEREFIAKNTQISRPKIKMRPEDEAALTQARSVFSSAPERLKKSELAKAAEAFFQKYSNEFKVFGPDCEVKFASEFDDVVGGIDLVVIKKGKNGQPDYIFAIDLVIGDTSHIDGKLFRVKKDIEDGHISEIKYPDSNGGEPIKDVPRFVVAIESSVMQELFKNKLKLQKLQDDFAAELSSRTEPEEVARINRIYNPGIAKTKRLLEDHPFNIEVVEEILHQAKLFSSFAAKLGKKDLALKLGKAISFASEILGTPQKRLALDHYYLSKKPSLDKLDRALEGFR